MVKNIIISSEEEKNNLISYLKYKKHNPGLTKDQKKAIRRKSLNIKYINDKLVYNINNTSREVICLHEDSKINGIIQKYHLPDHMGINKVVAAIGEKYIGITQNHIKSYLQRCDFCQRTKKPKIEKAIKPIIPQASHERLIIDLVDFSNFSDINSGFKYCCTMIDSFSKFAFAFPLISKHGCVVAGVLEKLFLNEGPWYSIHTDNGREFINENMNSLCVKFGIKHIKGRPYHPQSQGQIERFNRTLKTRLLNVLEGNHFKWTKELAGVVYRYNNTQHRATRIKPFVLYRGKNPSKINTKYNMTENAFKTRERYQRYVLSYKRELDINSTANIVEGDKVLLLDNYRTSLNSNNIVRNSLYKTNLYEVMTVNFNCVTIKDIITSELRMVDKTKIKKFIEYYFL